MGAIIKVLIRSCGFYIFCLPVLLQFLQKFLENFGKFQGGLGRF